MQPKEGARAALFAILGLLLVHTALLVLTAWKTPWTSDEHGYLFAGMALAQEMKFGTFETIKHGPLPFLANQLGDSFGFSLQKTLEPTDNNRLSGRLGMMLFSLIAAACLARLTWKAYGPIAAVGAVALFTMQPLVLGHGSLMTADMALTAGSLLFLLSLFMWLQRGGWLRLMLLSVCLGVALATKYLAVLLVPVLILALLIGTARGFTPHLILSRRSRKAAFRWLDLIGALQIMALVATVSLHACYLFQGGFFGPIGQVIPGGDLAVGGLLAQIRDLGLEQVIALLPKPFVEGVDFQLTAGSLYDNTMFWNSVVPGHWAYYFVGLLTKLTLPLLLLLGLGLLLRLTPLRPVPALPKRLLWPLTLTALLPLLYLSFFTTLQIGVRYALPLVPILCLLASRPLPALWEAGWRGRVLIALAGLVTVGSLAVSWPRTIDYFHVFADRRPYLLFGDSNLDWQRDALLDPNLARLQKDYPQAKILNYPDGPRFGPLLVHGLSLWPIAAPTHGPVQHWLRHLWPKGRRGSWFYFDVSEKDMSWATAQTGVAGTDAVLDLAVALAGDGQLDRANKVQTTGKVRQLLDALSDDSAPADRRRELWMDVGRFDKVIEDPGAPPSLRAAACFRRQDWQGCREILLPQEKAGTLPESQMPLLVESLARTGKVMLALTTLRRHMPPKGHPNRALAEAYRDRYRREVMQRAELKRQILGQ